MTKTLEFKQFAEVLLGIESTTKRLEKQFILSSYLQKVIKQDITQLDKVLFMCSAIVHPPFMNLEMNIGESTIQLLLTECTGMNLKNVRDMFKTTGDYGAIIESKKIVNSVHAFVAKKETVTVESVFGVLRKLCSISGSKSGNQKKNAILDLVRDASQLECKFIVRLLESKLKIGLALQTVLISLALALDVDSDIIKAAYNKRPDFEFLSKVIAEDLNGLENIKIFPGVPLKPMLATPVCDYIEASSKFRNILAEFKYDGERCQIHSCEATTKQETKEKQKQPQKTKSFFIKTTETQTSQTPVESKTITLYNKIFSRNNENVCEKYKDVAQIKFNEKSYILDGEVVAFSEGKILPFQVLSTRKRKNVDKIEVEVCIFVFDILYYDGVELLDMPLSKRREILKENFKEIPGKFQFAQGAIIERIQEDSEVKMSELVPKKKKLTKKEMVSSEEESDEFIELEAVEQKSESEVQTNTYGVVDPVTIKELFDSAVEGNCEGLMMKDLDATYAPSHRSNKWIKLKKDYMENLGDSVDLVVIGAYFGKGKRTGKYGGFLLGVYNDETDSYEACCKIGTGFSDEDLQKYHDTLRETEVPNDVNCNEKPDVFIIPEKVWEVKAASLSVSPLYKAGASTVGNGEKGISLRFPRFIREREDKGATEATTTNQLVKMYYTNLKNGKNDESDEWN